MRSLDRTEPRCIQDWPGPLRHQRANKITDISFPKSPPSRTSIASCGWSAGDLVLLAKSAYDIYGYFQSAPQNLRQSLEKFQSVAKHLKELSGVLTKSGWPGYDKALKLKEDLEEAKRFFNRYASLSAATKVSTSRLFNTARLGLLPDRNKLHSIDKNLKDHLEKMGPRVCYNISRPRSTFLPSGDVQEKTSMDYLNRYIDPRFQNAPNTVDRHRDEGYPLSRIVSGPTGPLPTLHEGRMVETRRIVGTSGTERLNHREFCWTFM